MAGAIAGSRSQRMTALALVAAYFLYVWIYLDPALLFETNPRFPAFAQGFAVATRLLTIVGGPNAYLAAWLAQWFRYAWIGSVILTAVTVVLCLAWGRYLSALSGRRPLGLVLAPATLTLVIYNQFGQHLADVMAVALAVVGAAVYALPRRPGPAARGVLFAGLSVLLYYVIGGPYLVFVALCAVCEFTARRNRLAGLLYLAAAEVLPQVLGVYVLDLTTAQAFARGTPLDSTMYPVGRLTLAALWLSLIVAAVVMAGPHVTAAPATGTAAPLWRRLRPTLLAVLLVLPVPLTYRPLPRLLLQVDYLLQQGRYEDVLRLTRRAHFATPPVQLACATNQALYHLGRLPDEMFRYPQGPEGLLIGMISGPGLSPGQIRAVRYDHPFSCAEAYLDFGLINQAEHEASEALEIWGPHARTLRVLAQVNIIKRRPEAARRFLQALARSPAGAPWARAKLAALQADPDLSADPRVGDVRAHMPLTDTGASDIMLEEQCQALLRRNPTNRQAFEYLMAYYLLNRELDKFAAAIERLPQLGYSEVPRGWQEALVLHEAATGHVVGLAGYRMDPESYAAFARFSGILGPLQHQGDMAAARAATVHAFGNTYFFYYIFGESGVGRA